MTRAMSTSSRVALSTMSDMDLIKRYIEVGVAQDDAVFEGKTALFNRLYQRKIEITDELKRRDGDHRRQLVKLYNHPSLRVRLNAAQATLSLMPEAARSVIEDIARLTPNPHAGAAGMCLWALDEGIFKPE